MIYKCTECCKDYFVSDQNHNINNEKVGLCINCQNRSKNPVIALIRTYNPKIRLSSILLFATLLVVIFVVQISPLLQKSHNALEFEDDYVYDNVVEQNTLYSYKNDLPQAEIIVENEIMIGYIPVNGDINTPQQIMIPNNVKEISDYAFRDFNGLVAITLGEKVQKIGKNAFSNCVNLEHVVLNDNLKVIDDYAFFRLDINYINLPPNLEYLGVSSLNNVNMNDVELSTKTKLGSDCLDFTTYYSNGVDDGEAIIINNLFIKAPTNDKIELDYKIPIGITSIEDNAFYSSNIENITIPEGVLYIGPRAFMLCKNLKEVTFPSTLIAIDTYAFYNCSSLTKVEFNAGLLALGYQSFEGCPTEKLNIPPSTKVVENLF